ncbi:hypothetical protein ACQJBY_018129 [Aegilops geniculata]
MRSCVGSTCIAATWSTSTPRTRAVSSATSSGRMSSPTSPTRSSRHTGGISVTNEGDFVDETIITTLAGDVHEGRETMEDEDSLGLLKAGIGTSRALLHRLKTNRNVEHVGRWPRWEQSKAS